MAHGALCHVCNIGTNGRTQNVVPETVLMGELQNGIFYMPCLKLAMGVERSWVSWLWSWGSGAIVTGSGAWGDSNGIVIHRLPP
eukprot:563701-Ditylum_brightwellii.AAC.1